MNNHQGWININKPINITSFGVVKKIKKIFKNCKVGHAGTLDPLAEGVLPIAIGKATKLISYITNQTKEYEFEIKWGEQTSTDDGEGEIISQSQYLPSYEEINSKIKDLKGEIYQKPPKASAIKINGIRSYKLLNTNKKFEMKVRIVKLYDAKIIDFSKKNITKISIKCGKGFYVRSFARDLAELLGTKGYVYSLKRTKVGKFSIKNAILLDDLSKIRQRHLGFKEIHTPISMLDDILAVEIDNEKVINEISHGRSVEIDKSFFLQKSLSLDESSEVFLIFKNRLLSLGKFDGNLFKPKKVFI